jgi:hypothetical protein
MLERTYLNGEAPVDPWGSTYLYRFDNLQPEVVSYGADGKPGGEFFDMDISSRNMWHLSPQAPIETRTQRIWIAVWFGAWIGLQGFAYLLWKSLHRSRRQAPM